MSSKTIAVASIRMSYTNSATAVDPGLYTATTTVKGKVSEFTSPDREKAFQMASAFIWEKIKQ